MQGWEGGGEAVNAGGGDFGEGDQFQLLISLLNAF